MTCMSIRCSWSPIITVRHRRPDESLCSSPSPGRRLAVATGVSSEQKRTQLDAWGVLPVHMWRWFVTIQQQNQKTAEKSSNVWPSHSRSLPLLMNSRESVSSGVSMSSTLMSRSSGVSRKSSESTEPSLWSSERFMSGATRVRRLRSPTFRVVGGSGRRFEASADTKPCL